MGLHKIDSIGELQRMRISSKTHIANRLCFEEEKFCQKINKTGSWFIAVNGGCLVGQIILQGHAEKKNPAGFG